ncbi:MAG: type 2 isopentenyl-diphosphate Delta-isomerase [Acidobacteriota bacterium]
MTAAAPAEFPSPANEPRDRKQEHIELSLDERMQLEENFFDEWVLEHAALPEIDLATIDTHVDFLGTRLGSPILVSCMTGGTDSATMINRNLAVACEEKRIALGVGSQRKALEDPSTAATFAVVREVAPTVPVIANLGAVQLNYGFGTDECQRAVEMVGASALALHLNPLQEALQPEGQGNFTNLLPKIADVARQLDVPVIVKEIGCGITGETARRLYEHGVGIVDVAGVGGTSWARIEAARADDVPIGELFAGWGIPTPESILEAVAVEGLTVIGSGGVRSGIDVAKCVALGADLAGLAKPFLAPALDSVEAVIARIERLERTLKIAMFCSGAATLLDLKNVNLTHRPSVTRSEI